MTDTSRIVFVLLSIYATQLVSCNVADGNSRELLKELREIKQELRK